MFDLDSSMRQTLVSSFIYDQERERSDASHESGLKKDEPSDFKGSSKLDDSTYSIVTQQADRYSKTKLSLDTNILIVSIILCQDILLFFVRSKRCARLRSATITLSFQLVRKVDSAIEDSDQDTESTTSQKKHSGEIISKFLCTSSITCVSYFDNISPF